MSGSRIDQGGHAHDGLGPITDQQPDMFQASLPQAGEKLLIG